MGGTGWTRGATGKVLNPRSPPPIENLAYPIRSEGELDLPEIWAEPLAVVVGELESRKTYAEVIENLPDIQLVESRQPGRHADT